MTVAEMIKRLSKFPDNAKVHAWNPNTECYEDVTGFLFLPKLVPTGCDLIEIQTDEP